MQKSKTVARALLRTPRVKRTKEEDRELGGLHPGGWGGLGVTHRLQSEREAKSREKACTAGEEGSRLEGREGALSRDTAREGQVRAWEGWSPWKEFRFYSV